MDGGGRRAAAKPNGGQLSLLHSFVRQATTNAEAPVTGVQGYFDKIRRVLASLFVDVEPQKRPGGPRTRASDHIPPMDFRGPAKDLPPKNAVDHPQPQPAKSNAR